jgi:hypothetical protein
MGNDGQNLNATKVSPPRSIANRGGITAADRARISVLWPTADAFYDERDDRTRRLIADVGSYASRTVECWIDPTAAGDITVQRMALVACNLSARWARRVRLVCPLDVPLALELRRDDDTMLAQRVLREMTLADPFGDWCVCSPADVVKQCGAELPLRLFIGPWAAHGNTRTSQIGPSGDDYHIDAASWTVLAARGADGAAVMRPWRLHATASVPAAALAGALGAADLFKRAIGHSGTRSMPTFAWDLWDHSFTRRADAWDKTVSRPVHARIDLAHTLLAGAGAIGSALVYIADLAPLDGELSILDRDCVETSNLNRSPLFTVLHVLDGATKPDAVSSYLAGRGLAVSTLSGTWAELAPIVQTTPFDVWISLTNEDGAWAQVPFQLPPVVLHGTTTSGWGFGAGRHIPRRDDCTLCRMPRPHAEFRGPCAEGEIGEPIEPAANPIRASLPFLSAAAAALVLAERIKLDAGPAIVTLTNDVSADLGTGLPVVQVLNRGPATGCRGCRAGQTDSWTKSNAGKGRYALYSLMKDIGAAA